jgi:hypothetical protein
MMKSSKLKIPMTNLKFYNKLIFSIFVLNQPTKVLYGNHQVPNFPL